MKSSFAERAIQFHRNLKYTGELPRGIKVLNPFRDNPDIDAVVEAFYTKFYADTHSRKLIVGINPGRLGAGTTGIPFTDTKRLREICGIDLTDIKTHEPSSVFVYKVIEAYGGASRFYRDFYIDSVCPLGFVRQNKKGNWVNCNYYDYASLFKATKPFIVKTLRQQIAMGIDPDTVYVLGKKNAKFLRQINAEERLFGAIKVFNHPRYIVQYKSKSMADHVNEYLLKLTGN